MILLTGATGFLGSHLLDQLILNNKKVAITVRSESHLNRIEKLIPHPNIKIYDIERNKLEFIFKENRIETIIHTATEYGRSGSNIYKIIDTNIALPIKIVELGIEYGTKCFINTDSYFNKGNFSYSNLLNYSLSKKSLLTWLNLLSNKIQVINMTLEHMYGPHDSRSKFVENLIQQVSIEKIEKIGMTYGHQKRDFIFVDDVTSAFIKVIDYAANHKFTIKNFEIGTGDSVEIRHFAQLVKELSHSPTMLGFGDIPYRSDEIMDSKADTSELLELGWAPQFNIQRGICKILNTYGVDTTHCD